MQKQQIFTYSINEVVEYINWIYFFHAWGFSPKYAAINKIHQCQSRRASWVNSFINNEKEKALEVIHLYEEALEMLKHIGESFNTHAFVRLCNAYTEGDDVILDGIRFPFLRQQTVKKSDAPYLCLSDFVKPFSQEEQDTVGVFAATVDREMEHIYDKDEYKKMLLQTLCDRLVEATTEKMHETVRRTIWGYVPNEHLSIDDLLLEKFQGIRPAVGYPSLPDQSVNFIIDNLINFEQLNIYLTENGAMIPHASVSGLMFSHPQSRYFAIGKIGNDQLENYAKRRNINIEQMRKFLACCL